MQITYTANNCLLAQTALFLQMLTTHCKITFTSKTTSRKVKLLSGNCNLGRNVWEWILGLDKLLFIGENEGRGVGVGRDGGEGLW